METTPRCKMAVRYAANSLAGFGHAHVSSAHLVLGLLSLQAGVACNVLRQAGLSVASVETYLSARRTPVEEISVQDGIAWGQSARQAFERAAAEAQARNHTYLGVEHLLLGILAEAHGEATHLFDATHLDGPALIRTIHEEIG